MFRNCRQSQPTASGQTAEAPAADAPLVEDAAPTGMREAVIPALAALASRVASTTASAAGNAAFHAAVAAKAAAKTAAKSGAETVEKVVEEIKSPAPAKAARSPRRQESPRRKKWFVLALLAGAAAAFVALKTKKEQPADPWAAPTLTPPPSAPSAPVAEAELAEPEAAEPGNPEDPDEQAELDTWADESPAEMDSPFQEGTEVPNEPGN